MNFMPLKSPWFDLLVFVVGIILITRMVVAGQFSALEGFGALLMAAIWVMFRFFRHDVPWKLVGWLVLALWVVAMIGAYTRNGIG